MFCTEVHGGLNIHTLVVVTQMFWLCNKLNAHEDCFIGGSIDDFRCKSQNQRTLTKQRPECRPCKVGPIEEQQNVVYLAWQ